MFDMRALLDRIVSRPVFFAPYHAIEVGDDDEKIAHDQACGDLEKKTVYGLIEPAREKGL